MRCLPAAGDIQGLTFYDDHESDHRSNALSEASIVEAKAQMTRLIHRAEQGEVVHITRRGKPFAVLLSREDYARLLQG